MKKILTAVAVSLFAVLMVLPVTASVNISSGKLIAPNSTLLADGNPIPPFPPQAVGTESIFVADGNPIPPFPPQALNTNSSLIADGNPIPPFPPQAFSTTLIV
jgi:hypothetical protein